MGEAEIEQARYLQQQFYQYIFSAEEDSSEFEISDPDIDYCEDIGLVAEITDEDPSAIEELFKELRNSEALSMLDGCEENSLPRMLPKQLMVFIEIVEFMEAQVGFPALESLITSAKEEILKYEKLVPEEENALNSWVNFKMLSFEIREQSLRSLLFFLHFYVKCEVDFASSPLSKRLENLLLEFDLPRTCYCCFLSMLPSLLQESEKVCTELIKRIGKDSDFSIECAGSHKTLSIDDIWQMLPEACAEYTRAAKSVCTCQL